MRRTWATFAASIGRDPKWIAAQIGHTDPQFTFSIYQQVATRRYIDEQAIWTVMRFPDEPAERAKSRQISRVERDDPRGPFIVEKVRPVPTRSQRPREGMTRGPVTRSLRPLNGPLGENRVSESIMLLSPRFQR